MCAKRTVRMWAVGLMVALSLNTALAVQINSDPPGAQIWVSPEYDPTVRLVGPSPVSVEAPKGKRLEVICRMRGYYSSFVTVSPEQESLRVCLTPLPTDLRDLVVIGWRDYRPGPWVGPMARPQEAWQVANAETSSPNGCDTFLWSPDGRYIAWSRKYMSGEMKLFSRLLLVDTFARTRRELARSYVAGRPWQTEFEAAVSA